MDREACHKALAEIVGEKNVLTSPADLENYGNDWTKRYTPDPLLAVLPGSTQEVSRVLAFCNKHRIPVVPSGGRTGLAGGAVAMNKEVVVSMGRMNRIEKIDPVGMFAKVEAGVTTEALKDAVAAQGMKFAPDFASKGTAQIGGNISTNAGGLRVIRYGGTRESVLGIEVVLATGEVLDLNRSLRKDNTGIDLKHLFIGTEGILGIITRATVKLVPQANPGTLSCLAVQSVDDIPKVVNACNIAGLKPSAFEFFSANALEAVLKHMPTLRPPFQQAYPYNLLLELDHASFGLGGTPEEFLEKILNDGLVADAVLAQSPSEYRDLWALRENITESLNQLGRVRKNDLSVSIDEIGAFITGVDRVLAAYKGPIMLVRFGHIGDGNVHINYVSRGDLSLDDFTREARDLELRVFEVLEKCGGSVSAEHGIGLVKKDDIHFTRQSSEIEWMKRVKAVFDPHGIMNPGKIF